MVSQWIGEPPRDGAGLVALLCNRLNAHLVNASERPAHLKVLLKFDNLGAGVVALLDGGFCHQGAEFNLRDRIVQVMVIGHAPCSSQRHTACRPVLVRCQPPRKNILQRSTHSCDGSVSGRGIEMDDTLRPATDDEVTALLDPIERGAVVTGTSMVVVFLRDTMMLAGICDHGFLQDAFAQLVAAYPNDVSVHWLVVDGVPQRAEPH
jgi:hypothetical protein